MDAHQRARLLALAEPAHSDISSEMSCSSSGSVLPDAKYLMTVVVAQQCLCSSYMGQLCQEKAVLLVHTKAQARRTDSRGSQPSDGCLKPLKITCYHWLCPEKVTLSKQWSLFWLLALPMDVPRTETESGQTA